MIIKVIEVDFSMTIEAVSQTNMRLAIVLIMIVFKTGSCCVAQTNLELTILLSLPQKFWDGRYEPQPSPHPAPNCDINNTVSIVAKSIK
jgi:hypothetical protein